LTIDKVEFEFKDKAATSLDVIVAICHVGETNMHARLMLQIHGLVDSLLSWVVLVKNGGLLHLALKTAEASFDLFPVGLRGEDIVDEWA